VPEGVQIADGPDALRRAVREQVKFGADWIKYYADRRYFSPRTAACAPGFNFTTRNRKAIVDEAHRLGRKVAPTPWPGTDRLGAPGRVDTIEHGWA